MRKFLTIGSLIACFILPDTTLAQSNDAKIAQFLNSSTNTLYALQSTFQGTLGINSQDTKKALIRFGGHTVPEYCGVTTRSQTNQDKTKAFMSLMLGVLASNYLDDQERQDFLSCVFGGNMEPVIHIMSAYNTNPPRLVQDLNNSFSSKIGGSIKSAPVNNDAKYLNTNPNLYNAFLKTFSSTIGIPPTLVRSALMNFASNQDDYFCRISLDQFTNPDKLKNFANFFVSVMTSGLSVDVTNQFLQCMFSGDSNTIMNVQTYFNQNPDYAINVLRSNIFMALKGGNANTMNTNAPRMNQTQYRAPRTRGGNAPKAPKEPTNKYPIVEYSELPDDNPYGLAPTNSNPAPKKGKRPMPKRRAMPQNYDDDMVYDDNNYDNSEYEDYSLFNDEMATPAPSFSSNDLLPIYNVYPIDAPVNPPVSRRYNNKYDSQYDSRYDSQYDSKYDGTDNSKYTTYNYAYSSADRNGKGHNDDEHRYYRDRDNDNDDSDGDSNNNDTNNNNNNSFGMQTAYPPQSPPSNSRENNSRETNNFPRMDNGNTSSYAPQIIIQQQPPVDYNRSTQYIPVPTVPANVPGSTTSVNVTNPQAPAAQNQRPQMQQRRPPQRRPQRRPPNKRPATKKAPAAAAK